MVKEISMWKDLPAVQKEEYKRMILAYASLTKMFAQKQAEEETPEDEKDIPSPIINAKYQETVFQKVFHASAEDIGNTSYDVSLSFKGNDGKVHKYLIGIKTFGIGSGDQKIAQFKAMNPRWSPLLEQIRRNALKEDGMTINFVPPTERFLTYRMHAIESNPESILVMLNDVTFPEIMRVAKDYGYVFEKCDQKYLENLLMKIRPNFKRLSDNINDKIENPGLISSMQDFYKVACSGKKPFKLNKVPKECLTEPFVYSVIRVSPGQIEYTPKKYMSDTLATVAVNSGDPLAIKYVKKPSIDLLRKAYETYDFSITCANNISIIVGIEYIKIFVKFSFGM